MSKLPSFQWYPGDWLKDPAVRSVSLSARGLWTDLLCLMWQSPRRGYLELNGKPVNAEQIARMTGCSTDEASHLLQELETAGVYSLTEHGTIYSRRMVRDEQKRTLCSEAGKRGGGNPALTFIGSRKGGPKGHPKGVPKASSSSSTSVKPPSIPLELDCPEFLGAWKRWNLHRAEIRKPLKATQTDAQLKQFSEWGVARSVAAINHTIAMGWQGIREPDQKTNGNHKARSDLEVMDFLRKCKQLPDGCFLGGVLNDRFLSVGFDGLSEPERRVAIDKCRRALERVR